MAEGIMYTTYGGTIILVLLIIFVVLLLLASWKNQKKRKVFGELLRDVGLGSFVAVVLGATITKELINYSYFCFICLLVMFYGIWVKESC